VFIDLVDGLGFRGDERRFATRGQHGHGAIHFLSQPFHHAIDERHIAENQAALHRVDRVATDGVGWLDDFDFWQSRGAGEKRFSAELNAGRDGATEVFAAR
jgi:hypothetical protein